MLATRIGPGKPAKQNTQVLDCALSVYPLLEGLIQSDNCTSVPEIVRRDGFAVSMIPQKSSGIRNGSAEEIVLKMCVTVSVDSGVSKLDPPRMGSL